MGTLNIYFDKVASRPIPGRIVPLSAYSLSRLALAGGPTLFPCHNVTSF